MSDLVAIKKDQALKVLTTGLDCLLDEIRAKVKPEVADISKKSGRDLIVSNAFKVTKSKTYIAGLVDDLIDQKKKEIEPTLNIIEELKKSKKKSNENLSDLAKETRGVVTEWEEAEKEKEAEKARLKAKAELERQQEEAILMNELYDIKRKEELARIAAQEKELAETAELERLETEKRMLEAAKVKAEADVKEAKETAEREKLAAIEAAEKSKRDAVAAEEAAKVEAALAEDRRIKAAEKAVIDADNAAEAAKQTEINRQKAEEKAAADEQLRLEKDRKHAGEIMKASKLAIMEVSGISEADAKKIVIAIKKNQIPNISIKF